MEYRGFEISELEDGWYATTGGGLITLGPFDTIEEAEQAVDEELGPE